MESNLIPYSVESLLKNSNLIGLKDPVTNSLSLLNKLSGDSDFLNKITEAYGNNFNESALDSLRQDWSQQNFSRLPQIGIVSDQALKGARGAFSQETNTIYLSQEFINLNAGNPDKITKVFLEEVGHWIDTQINTVDAAGDEGAIFSALATGGHLTNSQLNKLKIRDDFQTINIDGKTITVETASNAQDHLNLISSQIKPLLDSIKSQLEVEDLKNVPLVGEIKIKNFVDQLLNNVDNKIISEINSNGTATVNAVRKSLFDALGTSGLNILLDSNGDSAVTINDILLPQNDANAIDFQFKLGKTFKPNLSLADQLGLPTLGLDLNGGITPQLDLGLTVGFGVDKNANVFLDTKTSGELQTDLKANLLDASNNPLQAKATLGFLNLQATDNGSQLTGKFSADLTSTSADAKGRVKVSDLSSLTVAPDPKLTANADLKFKLNTGLGAAKNDILPSIESELNLLGWQYDSSNPATPAPSVSFDNVTLDTGSLVEDFAGGILKPIQDILKPIQSVLNPFITPLPVIDKSFLELSPNIPEETRKFIQVLNTLASLKAPSDSGKINLGSFNLTGGDIRTTDLSSTTATPKPAVVAPLASSLEPAFIQDLKDIGFDFPILDKPENTVDLLLGKPGIDLFKTNEEFPKFAFNYSIPDITIPVVGPIVIKIEGHAEAGAQIQFGYDSTGLATGHLEDGFYVVRPNADPKDPISRKNSNVYGEAEVDASAGVSVGVASLTVGGGINVGLGMNFAQSLDASDGLDGKVRGTTLFPNLPFCAFDVGGGLSVIIFGELELDLGFFSVTERLDLADIKLIDFDSKPDCHTADYFNHEDPEPTPEQQKSLDDAGIIDRRGTDDNNTITVDHLGGTWSAKRDDSTEEIKVNVKVNGSDLNPDPHPDPYDKVTLIVIKGLAGNDTIQFINGVEAPGQVRGGDGNDNITTGKGNDFIDGGQGNDTLNGGEGNNTADYSNSPNGVRVNLNSGFASNDGYGTQDNLSNIQNVEGSAKNDVIIGSNTKNYLNGGAGNDDLEGLDGDDDVILGGEGADTIRGGNGFDVTTYFDSKSGILVNLSNQTFLGNVTLPDGVSPLYITAHRGQGGSADGDFIDGIENVSGSAYDDILIARDGDGIIDGWLGNDIIYAGSGHDTLIGGDGSDWLSYKLSNAGVNVNLKDNAFSGGYAEGDKLQTIVYDSSSGKGTPQEGNSFENLEGSLYSDGELRGDDNNNLIRGLSGDDNIYGEGGNDLLNGGAGADHLDGGTGEDTVTYLESTGAVYADLLFNQGFFADAQGDTFSNVEDLTGSNYGDNLNGDNGNNKIDPSLSGSQLDIVDGRGGTDTLLVDYSIDDYGEGIEGGFNTGDIKHYADSSKTSVLDQVGFTNIESLSVAGTIRNDSIIGGSGNDVLRMSDGNDFVDGGGGNDLLDGDRGIDTLSDDLSNKTQNISLESFDITQESSKSYYIDGTNISNFEIFKDIKTGSGNDRLTQLDRINNNFSTGAGADTVNGGLGFDSVDGGKDTVFLPDLGEIELPVIDTLVVDYSVGDTGSGMIMFVTPEDKTGYAYRSIDPNNIEASLLDSIDFSNFENYQVTGTSKEDTIVLGNGNDSIIANAGNDYLRSNGGNDYINAGEGNDVLIGSNQTSADIDTLEGGAGADLFLLGESFVAGTNLDPHFYDKAGTNDYALITDFNVAEGDKIQLPNCGVSGLSFDRGYTLIDFGSFGNGSGLYSERGNELIAFLQGAHGLDLNAPYFEYVGDPCPEPPK
ncbi:calcium-binding protein [Gloeothece verrucosa]|uniref:Hemolysin-type calcium-binding region n=1 Tax=Gloeothece verrucosa (strain PCC 7822) TaxID=497965 RepID=E0UKT0_GLOV7|nr:calcium-binding protein [Gloeothece verrucosa]ADN17560.1 Hemolysin-type calcium-binding region [Gloeothece verrucosa PCC 7822]